MAVKNSQRFAEIERLMGDYFGCHLAPVMGRVQRDLSNRQADEMRAYSNSTAGILRSLATANRLQASGTARPPKTIWRCARRLLSATRICSVTLP